MDDAGAWCEFVDEDGAQAEREGQAERERSMDVKEDVAVIDVASVRSDEKDLAVVGERRRGGPRVTEGMGHHSVFNRRPATAAASHGLSRDGGFPQPGPAGPPNISQKVLFYRGHPLKYVSDP